MGKDYSELNYAEQIKYKSREISKLRNRVERYKSRLLREAFEAAKRERIKVLIGNSSDLYHVHGSTILICEDHKDNVDITSMISLAKDSLPSLYRRYNESLNKFNKEYDRLEEMVEQAA